MSTISPTTANKQAITRTVTSSVRSHVQELVTGVEAILYPDGSPADFNLQSFFLALTDALERDFQELAAADREVAREVGEDQQARAVRDERTDQLREILLRVRSAVSATFSATEVIGLGLSGRTPERAEALVPFARNAAEKLASARVPASAPGFVQFDFVAASRELEEKAGLLDDALTELARDIRETQAVQGDHIEANAAWQRHYGPIARMIEGSFLLAGMEHQAARVRPTARRSAGRPEQADLVESESVGGEVSEGSTAAAG